VVSLENQKEDKVRLGIRDTGHGIPDDKKDKIFQPFQRFDLDANNIEGTGIGLTISKQLVELMNGTLGFESVLGKGSYFYIDIPLSDKTPLPIPIEEESDSIQPSLAENIKKGILYIEDIPANVNLVKRILTKRPHIELISASNALDGIKIAQTQIPDLILMDIHLPGMDGLTAFKKLRTIEATRNIPVIALTAGAMDSQIKKAMAMGFHSYITKPIEIPKFLNRIDGVLS